MQLTLDLNALGVSIFVVDVETGPRFRLIGMNTTASREFGFPASHIAGRLFEEAFSERMASVLRDRYATCLRTRQAHQFEEFADLANGRQWFRTTLSPCLDPVTGAVWRIMSISQNVSSAKRLQMEMQQAAFEDPLTGLLNRRGFDQAVTTSCERAIYSGAAFSLVVVDLDDLKTINDAFGHRAGDEAIRTAGQTLAGFLRNGEDVARVGGDEFYLLLLEPTRIDLDRRLDRLRALVENGLYAPNLDKPLSLSAGGSVWHPGDDAYEVLASADAEMYAIKAVRRLTGMTAMRSMPRTRDVA